MGLSQTRARLTRPALHRITSKWTLGLSWQAATVTPALTSPGPTFITLWPPSGEMLARVLLTLHNLHHYQAFFVALQSAIRDGQVDELRRVVLRGYHHPAG